MNRLLLLLVLVTGIYSCGNNGEPKEGENNAAKKPDEDTSAYLPLADFLRDDIRNVDSFSTAILRKATTGNKKDSGFIKLPEFHRIAEQFLMKELDSASFHQHFSETSLMDETSRLLHFYYTPKDSMATLRQVIAYVAPSLANDNIDRIYMETATAQGDTTIQKKLTWKMRKYLYVLTIKQPQTGDPITSMEKLIWDPQHFGDK